MTTVFCSFCVNSFATSADGRFCICGHKTFTEDKIESYHTYILWDVKAKKATQKIDVQNPAADFYGKPVPDIYLATGDHSNESSPVDEHILMVLFALSLTGVQTVKY